MKLGNSFLIVFVIIFNIVAIQTKAQTVPSISIYNANEKPFNTNYFATNDDKLTVLSFWATWCIPCINELSTINDNIVDWQKKQPFHFYAISVDDSRAIKKVMPLANGKGWGFSILLDKNQDLKRALNINSIPYTVVIKNGKIIHRINGYTEGDEFELFQFIKNDK